MVIVAVSPPAMFPSEQVMGVFPFGGEQLPWLGMAGVKSMSGG